MIDRSGILNAVRNARETECGNFLADFDLRFSAQYTSNGRYGTATLTITRIESGAL